METGLVHLFNDRLSVDNTVRKDAENRLVQLKNENPDVITAALLSLLRQHASEEVRQQAAIHLKHIIRDASEPGDTPANLQFWGKLQEATRIAVKSELFGAIGSDEPSSMVRSAVVDTITLLAHRLLPENGWTDLNPLIFALLTGPNPRCQVSGLQLLSGLLSDLSDFVKKNINVLQDIVSRCMQSNTPEVRIECIALVACVVESEKRSVWKTLQPCIPSILQCLASSLQSEGDASKILISLIDIAEYDSAFYLADMKGLASTMFHITCDSKVADREKQLAVELLLTMCESKPKQCKKSEGFVDELLSVLLEMMRSIPEDPDWVHANPEEDEEEEEDEEGTSNAELAGGGLDRVAFAVGGDFVLPKLYAVVAQYIQQPGWQFKHAALMAISQTVEHVPEEQVESYMAQIVPFCLAQITNEHPRVRYACVQSIGQAASDMAPLFQEQYVSTVLPALMNTLDDPVPRIQAHAGRSLTNFCEALESEQIEPYVDALVDKLLKRLAPGTPTPLMASCVTALAVVASAAEAHFSKYYQVVVPAMKQVVRSFSGSQGRQCREKALECITLIALAVGYDTFAADAEECMQAITQLWVSAVNQAHDHSQQSDTAGEGPSEVLNEALCRMCRVLTDKFVPYLLVLMPGILQILAEKPLEVDLEDIAAQADELCLVGLLNGKSSAMKTQVMMEVEQMTSMVYTFAATLGDKFREYLPQTIIAVLPLLEFQYCDKIMENALNTLSECFKIGRAFAEAEPNEAQKNTLLRMLSGWLWTTTERSFVVIEDEQSLAECQLEVPKGLAKVLKQAGSSLLTVEQVGAICTKCFELLELSRKRHQGILEEKLEEHDEDDEDDILGEQSFELEFATSLIEILAACMEHHPEFYLQTSSQITVDFIRTQLAQASLPAFATAGGGVPLTLALYVLCEVMTMKEKSVEIWQPFFPSLLQSLESTDPTSQQPAAHGIKLAAKLPLMTGETAISSCRALLSSLDRMNMKKQPLDSADQGAMDNIVSGLGALIFHQSNHLMASGDPNLSVGRLLQIWLSHLPLKSDDSEGQLVHADLINLVLARNETVMGASMCNLPHLMKIFASIYKTSFSSPELDKQLVTIAKDIGENTVRTMQLSLDKEQRRMLERLFLDVRSVENNEPIKA